MVDFLGLATDPQLGPLVSSSDWVFFCQPRQGQNRFEAVAEAQEDFNEMVQEAAARFQPGKEWLPSGYVKIAIENGHL